MGANLGEVFDTHLYPEGLSDRDLETLRFFGVSHALCTIHPSRPQPSPKELLGQFDRLVRREIPRLEGAGIRALAAVGVPPNSLPRRGFAEVMGSLPSYFRGGRVVALGEIGLKKGTEEEEAALAEQLELARRLSVPVLVSAPPSGPDALTRRLLQLIRDSQVRPVQVLVENASVRMLRPVLECGHFAGLSLHPDVLPFRRAIAWVRKAGVERLVLSSSAGLGASDLLAVPYLASRLKKAGLSDRVVACVSERNARAFLLS